MGKWFEATYPGPVQYDVTGRMIHQPRRDRPASAPSWVQGKDAMSLRGPEKKIMTGAVIPGGRRKPRRLV